MNKAFLKMKESGGFIFLIGLTILAFSYAMFQGGFVSWFLFYSSLPFIIYAFSLFFYPLSCTAERMLSKQEFIFNESVRIQLTVVRKSRFPLFYMILEEQAEESFTLKEKQQQKILLLPGFKKTLQFEYEIDQLPRGEHHFTGIRMKTGDLFGFIEKEKLIPLENKIVVYPLYEELSYRPFAGQVDQGTAITNRRVYRDQDMAMSVGIRNYLPGDRLSLINWKATAKRNDLMTKEFEQHRSHDLMIVMDCTPAPQFETVVSFTASAIRGMIRTGTQVGLLTVSDERRSFTIRGGDVQGQRLFYHLAKIKDKSAVSFARVLEKETFLAQQGRTLMLVTSQLTEEVVERARYYSRRSQSVIIFLINGKQGAGPDIRITAATGIQIRVVQEGQFGKTFSEVNGR
ncbi:DUF58 domain-containing protein [Domibacillus sp. A3M-37]|uniref:DUF58 domain-containing protein n=1 Tax=Domibacillus sp. A3M-37 TaxID=2962037 RepID=UPI0020B6607A|nr:DUF58 domain-containing protein [Domibacillus sp. A3M-37]MCP3763530.1 DUF58 domain-containing protein [Domibacillus sp. A3M-37]